MRIQKLKNTKFINIKALFRSTIYINEIVVSNNFPFGDQYFKNFVGYKDNKDIRPLCIFFPEMSIYKRYSDKTKCMYFMRIDEKKFGKYMAVWEKVRNKIKKLTENSYIYHKNSKS